MEPLRLNSAREAFELVLEPPHGTGQQAWFVAELTGPEMRARISVYEPASNRVARFFADMAREWTGWRGERTWASLEGHLRLTATTDRLGHIYLEATLRDPFAGARWQAQAVLVLEAGQLERIANTARRVFGESATA